MSEYRNRTTGVVKTQGQWRNEFANMSLPRVWKAATLDALDLDPVLRSPAATVGDYQVSVRDGVEQNANGDWVERYVARDMFADIGCKTRRFRRDDRDVAGFQFDRVIEPLGDNLGHFVFQFFEAHSHEKHLAGSLHLHGGGKREWEGPQRCEARRASISD